MMEDRRVTTNTEPKDKLYEAAEVLLAAAMAYWEEYQRAGLGAAVVWLADDEGRLIILTRGEYRHTLMENVHKVSRDEGDTLRTWGD